MYWNLTAGFRRKDFTVVCFHKYELYGFSTTQGIFMDKQSRNIRKLMSLKRLPSLTLARSPGHNSGRPRTHSLVRTGRGPFGRLRQAEKVPQGMPIHIPQTKPLRIQPQILWCKFPSSMLQSQLFEASISNTPMLSLLRKTKRDALAKLPEPLKSSRTTRRPKCAFR